MAQFIRNKKLEDEFKDSLKYVENNWSLYLEKQLLDIREIAAQQMKRGKISRAELAESLKCSRSYVTQLLNGNTNIRLSTLFKVLFSLGIKPRIEYSYDDIETLESFKSNKTIQMNLTESKTSSTISITNKIKEQEYEPA